MSKAQELIDDILSVYEPSSEIEEAVASRITTFQGGQRKVKLDCPPGYTLKGGACIRQSPQEVMIRRKAARKAARTLGASGRRTAAMHRMKSDAKRKMAGLS